MDSGELALTNVQEEKKNENRREIGVLNKQERGSWSKKSGAMQKSERYEQMCKREREIGLNLGVKEIELTREREIERKTEKSIKERRKESRSRERRMERREIETEREGRLGRERDRES